MPSSIRRGRLHRRATMALLLIALPLPMLAQVRRPDPAPAGPRAAATVSKRRSELVIGGGFVNLDKANATTALLPIGSLAFRRQILREWLFVGAAVDVGSTTIDGTFFPYEKRPIGDTLQYFVVDGSARLFSGRATADVLWPVDEAERFRAGFGLNAGVYAMAPTPAAGADAGMFIAPTFGAAFVGTADLTPRIGVAASMGFAQFTGFDREKLRPSDPALADPVFNTPLVPPPAAVKSFGGTRLIIGVSYRLGVKQTTGGRK